MWHFLDQCESTYRIIWIYYGYIDAYSILMYRCWGVINQQDHLPSEVTSAPSLELLLPEVQVTQVTSLDSQILNSGDHVESEVAGGLLEEPDEE